MELGNKAKKATAFDALADIIPLLHTPFVFLSSFPGSSGMCAPLSREQHLTFHRGHWEVLVQSGTKKVQRCIGLESTSVF